MKMKLIKNRIKKNGELIMSNLSEEPSFQDILDRIIRETNQKNEILKKLLKRINNEIDQKISSDQYKNKIIN